MEAACTQKPPTAPDDFPCATAQRLVQYSRPTPLKAPPIHLSRRDGTHAGTPPGLWLDPLQLVVAKRAS